MMFNIISILDWLNDIKTRRFTNTSQRQTFTRIKNTLELLVKIGECKYIDDVEKRIFMKCRNTGQASWEFFQYLEQDTE